MLAVLRRWSELVTFSHTIFALPFAASAVVLAVREPHVPLTAVQDARSLLTASAEYAGSALMMSSVGARKPWP